MENYNNERLLQDASNILTECERKLSRIEQKPIDMHSIDVKDYQERLNEIIRKVRGPEYDVISATLFELLTTLLKVYIDPSSNMQREIESVFRDKEYILNHLLSFPKYIAESIHSPQDTESLQIGLAAALILDNRVDFRDLFISLGELYTRAKDRGIDPVPHFKRIESLTTSNAYTSVHVNKSILSDFLDSEYLQSITAIEE